MKTIPWMAVSSILGLCVGAGCTHRGSALPQPPADGGGTQHPPIALCRFDLPPEPSRVVLATPRGTEVVLVRGDGGAAVAHTFAAPAAIVARGDYLAASALAPDSRATQSIYDVILLDREGHLLWSGRSGMGVDHGGGAGENFVLNEKGQLALSLPGEGVEGHDLLRVEPDGTTRVEPGYLPLDRPLADGTVYVRANQRVGEVNPTLFGWWSPTDGLIPLAVPQAPAVYPRRVADRLIYIGLSNGQVVLVSQSPTELKTFPLTNAAFGFLGEHVDSPWQLLHSFAGPPTAWLLDARTGLSTVDGAVFPPWPSIDETGALLRLRTDPSRAIWERSTDRGLTFVEIGGTLSGFQRSAVSDRGGTYVVTTSTHVGPFESPVTWDPSGPAAELRGESWQVARPASGSRYAWSSQLASIRLSADGRCAAYWHTTAGQRVLEALDVERGAVFPLMTEATEAMEATAQHRTPAWVSDLPL